MNKNILIAGGDCRQLFCAAKLAEEYDISVIGFDREKVPDGLKISDGKEKFGCVVLPVVSFDSRGFVNTPLFSENLSFEDLKPMLSEDSLFIVGKSDRILSENAENYTLREDFCVANAISTAEGAVKIALEELPVTLNSLPVLIVGLGRIGKSLAEILKGFGADITVAVHNAKGAANARLMGLKSIYTENISKGYRLVFNTVPSLVFDRELLIKSAENTLFIDLASKPGGIDFASAEELDIKVIWALGLPGKVSPVTAGETVAETVRNILSERGYGK